jgi:hypothetical protein
MLKLPYFSGVHGGFRGQVRARHPAPGHFGATFRSVSKSANFARSAPPPERPSGTPPRP